ncbi:hypothetical protein CJU94_34375 (plasmid) [Paraburkholderia aromaticivorans]|uniref:Uncharacterized protein n=1 Tax=Paraburkholderia aromaticivorans TaxID=2026199 RepID=A0A248VWB6_9BURK|nr:hypothetical protein CJU94_34375 [Paraburkholderia aromaticivorans]
MLSRDGAELRMGLQPPILVFMTDPTIVLRRMSLTSNLHAITQWKTAQSARRRKMAPVRHIRMQVMNYRIRSI